MPAVLLLVWLLSACGGGGGGGAPSGSPASDQPGATGSGADPGAGPNPRLATNSAPTISGQAPGSALPAQAYVFRPDASDADGDALRFSVENLPAWASFDSLTGVISGTPSDADVGSFSDILITVFDGEQRSQLPPFEIVVADSGPGSVELNWLPPTENTDGSSLTDLAGYRIYYGVGADDMNRVVTISEPGVTTYTVGGLLPDTYFFALTAINETGVESGRSATIQLVVD